MRLRRFAGVVTGALVAGSISISMSATSASAAVPVTVTKSFDCAYGNFSLPYDVTAQITDAGTAVTATLSDMPATGFPTGLKIAGFKATVGVDLDGEATTLTGENTYASNIAGGGTGVTVQLPMANVAGTRTGTAPVAEGEITSLGLIMKAGFQFNPAAPVTIGDNPLTCVAVPDPIAVSKSFDCAYGDFTLPYDVTAEVTGRGTAVTATMSDLPATGFPTGLKIAGFKSDVDLDLDGEELTLSGENTYATNIAGGGTGVTVQLPMTSVAGTRTGTGAVTEGEITGLDVIMKAGFQFNPAAPVTITDNVLVCTAVPVGPSAECIDAEADVVSATAAVKAATIKVDKDKVSVKKAKSNVKKAKKAVKKAKGKKAVKKAKKKLTKAKKAQKSAESKLKSDSKKLTSAKKALTTAKDAVEANC